MDPKVIDIVIEFSKAKKAVTFYPADHPVLKQIVLSFADTLKMWLGEHKKLHLHFRGQKIFYGSEAVGKDSQELRDLIKAFSQHQVREIVFSEGLVTREVVFLLKTISSKPELIKEKGGMRRLLQEVGVQCISLTEIDYDEFLEKDVFELKNDINFTEGLEFVPGEQEEGQEFQQEEEEQDPLAAAQQKIDLPPTYERDESFIPMEDIQFAQTDLERLLDEESQAGMSKSQVEIRRNLEALEHEADPKVYFEIVQRLIALCEELQRDKKLSDVLLAVLILNRHHEAEASRDAKQRNNALYGIQTIGNPELIRFMFDYFTKKDLLESQKNKIVSIIQKTGPSLIDSMIEILGNRKDLTSRRILMRVFTSFGSEALGSLHKMVGDKRWHVVRDIVAVLGEIGNPRSVIYLDEALSHPNAHVRREAIRALSKIHTVEAFELLLLGLKSRDPDTRIQTITCLGESQNQAALTPLLKLAKKVFVSQQGAEMKKTAIFALGDLGYPKALPYLRKILLSTGWSRFTGNQEIRLTAAHAVAKIGGPEAREILKLGSQINDLEVSQACTKLLEEMEKKR